MRISCVSTFYPYRGGIAQFNANLYRELEKNHEVQALTFTRQYPDFLFPGETQLVGPNDLVDPIPATRCLDTINPFSYWSTARRVREFAPDAMITKYWMTFFGPALGTVARNANPHTKRISILDNVIPHERRFFDNACNKYFLNANDGFVVMSDSVLNDLLSYRPDAQYIRLDHPVYDNFGQKMSRDVACAQLQLDPNQKHVLFFGFIRDYKGLDILLDAVNSLPEDYTVIVAGEVYGSFDKYDEQIDSLGIRDRIRLFNRYISDAEVPAFFSAADVCVLPYKSATQSGITAIAMHFGLPVIATDTGGLSELVLHERTGLIVPEPEPIQLATAIRRYFDEELKEGFIVQLEEEKKRLSWSAFSKQLVDFIATVERRK